VRSPEDCRHGCTQAILQEETAMVQVAGRSQKIIGYVLGPQPAQGTQIGQNGAVISLAQSNPQPGFQMSIHDHRVGVHAAFVQAAQDQAAKTVVAHPSQNADPQAQFCRLAGKEAARAAHLEGVIAD
jgi:hypothetical protein